MASVCYKPLTFVFFFIFLNHEAHGFFGRFPGIQFGASFNFQTSQDAQANSTINNLINDSQQMIQNAENEITSLGNAIENISNNVSQSGQENISALFNRTNASLEGMLSVAANLGENVWNCTQERISELEMIANNTLINMEQCFTEKLEQGANITRRLMQNFDDANYIAGNLTQGYEDCLRLANGNIFFIVSPNVLACKMRLISDNSQNIGALRNDIIQNVIAGSTYLSTLKVELEACVFVNAARAAESVAIITSQIAICVVT